KLSEQLTDEYDQVEPSKLPSVFRISPASADAYMTTADVAHLEMLARSMENPIVRQRVFAHLDERLSRQERVAG
ncbi:MAG: hypothetical protein KDA35_10445, partial [Hyphomonadaceae bacterium]|nr:hypothetical protein [Hyphomonadaceae bacterium]